MRFKKNTSLLLILSILENTLNVLGSPIIALYWAINELITYNLPIRKNIIITIGTCTIPIKFQKEDKLDAYFGEIGNVNVNIN